MLTIRHLPGSMECAVGSVSDHGGHLLSLYALYYFKTKNTVDIDLDITSARHNLTTIDEFKEAIVLILGTIRPGFQLGNVTLK